MSDVLVLCYHAVSARWDWEYATDPRLLEAQLSLLIDRGYRAATFSDAVLEPATAKTCAVTFDDAYLSVYEHALPVLSRLGLPGTVFACSDLIDGNAPMRLPDMEHWLGTSDEHELRGASWAQLRELADAGWEIGSHSASHPRLTRLDDRDLAEELTRSKQEVEHQLGLSCRSLAYPHGDVDARVVEAARGAGYTSAGGLLRSTIEQDRLLWPRVPVFRHDGLTRFRIKCLPAARRLRRSRAWSAARPVHELMRAGRPRHAHDL